MLGPEQLDGDMVPVSLLGEDVAGTAGAEGGVEGGVEGNGLLGFGGEGGGGGGGPSPFEPTQQAGIPSVSQQTVPLTQDPPPEVQQTPPAGAYVPSLQHVPSRG
jgi:hypothetical protein